MGGADSNKFASGPLPAAIAVGAWIDDRSGIDRRRRRDDHRLGRDHCRLSDHCGRSNHRRLSDHRGRSYHRRGRRHDSGRRDHNGVGRNDIMRERNRRRRQADNASREAESAVVVVMEVMSPREYARSGRQRKSHNNDFLRVHDLPHLSVYVEHHRPT